MPTPQIQRQLLDAIARGSATQTNELLQRGAEVNFRGNDPDGETPLMRAVAANHPLVVEILLKAGAKVNSAGKISGLTPLMLARSCEDVLRVLLLAGADINAHTPTREIALPENGGTVRWGGQTALHFAAAANHQGAVKILIEAGADVEARNAEGLAPLDLALRAGAPNDIAVLLIEAGAALTQERLELAHTAAHDPDSDLWRFPWSGEPQGSSVASPPAPEFNRKPSADQRAAEAGPSKFRCPNCHSLLYSRRPKICGQCGTILPKELLLNNEEADAAREERNWARDLADTFGARGSILKSGEIESGKPTQFPSVRPSELLAGTSYPEEFHHRQRPRFWVDLMFYLGVALGFLLIVRTAGVSPLAFLPIAALLGFRCYTAWNNANAVCPACQRNIRTCDAIHCHVCGDSLRSGRCSRCVVNHSGLPMLHPFTNSGNTNQIKHCPGCGVFLDTKVGRHRLTRGD